MSAVSRLSISWEISSSFCVFSNSSAGSAPSAFHLKQVGASANLGIASDEERIKNKMRPDYDISEWYKKGGEPKTGIKADFIKKVNEFKPDLILVSVVESTYFLAIDLLDSVPEKDRNYKTLFGGVFATYASDKIIKNKHIDYVCRGEGEDAVMEMCNRLITGDRIDNVMNFTLKGNGTIYNNKLRSAVDINSVPVPDWSFFDPGSLY